MNFVNSEEYNKMKRLFIDRYLYVWIMLDLAICFMLCIFAPIDIFYANRDEYWFTLGQMFPSIAGVFLYLFILFGGIFYFLNKSKIKNEFFSFFLFLYFYLYIQGNFIPRKYGVLDGSDILWGEYKTYADASIILGILCIVLCIIFSFTKIKKYIFKIGKYLCLFVLLIQVITIITLVFQHGLSGKTKGNIITQKDLLSVSKDQNVIVFLLDSYDESVFEELVNSDNENQKEIFENFTSYKDTLSTYPTTKCGVPYILTGEWYQNAEPYEDYIKRTSTESVLYKQLSSNNYEINMYTEPLYVNEDPSLYENVEVGNYKIGKYRDFTNKLFTLVAFNYMPHQLKKFFCLDTGAFDGLKAADTEDDVYLTDNIKFVNNLDNEGVHVSKTGKLFKFYHLDGIHGPYTFGKSLIEDGQTYSAIDEASGNSEILKKYFEQLKKAGVYDSSTIVILADHGNHDYCQNPIFLIKNANETHEFQVSDAKMSYEYLNSVWEALIKGKTVDEDFIKKCTEGKEYRRFLYYNWDDAWNREYMPGMEEMECKGDASDSSDLIPTGKTYYAERENHSFNLGSTLDFINERDVYGYVLYGITYGRVKTEALMTFDFTDNTYDNIRIDMTFTEQAQKGSYDVYVNDMKVGDFSYSLETKKTTLIVPHEYVKDGHMELKFVQSSGARYNDQYDYSGCSLSKMKIVSTSENAN